MSDTFDTLGICPTLIKALRIEQIQKPTEIQALVIPEILKGRDVIAESETGTGKTLAFLLPLFERFKGIRSEMKAIILAPTHELAIQIQHQIERLSQNSDIKLNCASILASANIKHQIDRLKDRPIFIVGSPPRILELIRMGRITAQKIRTIVLDEADRLMDLQNVKEVMSVIKSTQEDRQLLLFSATIALRTLDKAKEVIKDPLIIKAKGAISVPESIEHCYYLSEQKDKIETLRKLMRLLEPRKAMIFLNKNEQIDILASKLKHYGINAEGIHGTNIKLNRKLILDDFRKGILNVMIASDIAARGLHIDDITHIFNMDLPEDPKDYLHRAGRTGRNGKPGTAVSIVTHNDLPQIRRIEKAFDIKIVKKNMKGNAPAIEEFENEENEENSEW